jgi:L-lysine exporter family protein LysE/ArgO
MGPNMAAWASGFSLGLSLILPIGAQNSFVLRQGLRREHIFFVCLLCALSDALLMLAGISGLSVVIKDLPWLSIALRLFGILFLFAYGGRSFWRAWAHADRLTPGQGESKKLLPTLLLCLALTWLNPHVYLDTVLLIGSIAQQYPGQQYRFAFGAMTASCLFFFSFGYGAALLRPLLAKPLSWRILEAMIGACMWSIAASLALEFL